MFTPEENKKAFIGIVIVINFILHPVKVQKNVPVHDNSRFLPESLSFVRKVTAQHYLALRFQRPLSKGNTG